MTNNWISLSLQYLGKHIPNLTLIKFGNLNTNANLLSKSKFDSLNSIGVIPLLSLYFKLKGTKLRRKYFPMNSECSFNFKYKHWSKSPVIKNYFLNI